MTLTLINCGLASLTVAMRHTLSSKAEWSDRGITPSKPLRAQLGTGEERNTKKGQMLRPVKQTWRLRYVLV